MNRRRLSHSLGPREVRLLDGAAHAAAKAGLPFTVFLTVHLGLIPEARAVAAEYIRGAVVNRIGVWLRRRRVPWIALWVRENYLGLAREHVHLLMHLPRGHRAAFRAAVRRWWPEPISDLGPTYNVRGVVGYLSKQMSPQAHFAMRRRIRRERKCRRTGAPVAPVLGRRLGLSRGLRELVEGPCGTGPKISGQLRRKA
jgi:hypothetical protein